MPKPKRITETDIVQAALRLVEEKGDAALCARELARTLACSTQPIFSNFSSMEEVRAATLAEGYAFYGRFSADLIAKEALPPYKASGLAYILFAKKHPLLFHWLYMRNSSAEPSAGGDALFQEAVERIAQSTGFDLETATRMHTEMWALVHGFATMQATAFLEWDTEAVSGMLTDVYTALRTKFKKEKQHVDY